ncbi:MAG: DNA mismatch repair endonuclease MutL [candidate division Zixibacteria bacterium]|nr:DNA mismatch repair endonuclease MutL [candidate division Zixibacteria bacterium]
MSKNSKKNKRWIRPLPKQVINKIAAGEVVDRPASVVKELVENSIDAGANKIDILIEKSGSKLIKIVDDGCGIDEEQIEVAFSRHATSKIANFNDLESLVTYGFRGEALPSIASVSRLRMVSRTYNASSGFEIIYEGGVLQSLQPISAQPGTTIEVENLFFNTPARRKFMKSEATESRHISRTATAMALGRYNVGFNYIINNRKMFSLPSKQTLEDRVKSIIAPHEKFVEVKSENPLVNIFGYLGFPESAQRNRNGFYLFINDRFIQSPTIFHAVSAGFGELLPKGRFPVGTLLLSVDPLEVDVNVHPTKIEVRLSHEREIHDIVYRAVKESLKKDDIIPLFKTASPYSETNSTNHSQSYQSQANNYQVRIPGITSQPIQDKKFLSDLHQPPSDNVTKDFDNYKDTIQVDKNTGEIIDSTQSKKTEIDSGPRDGFKILGRFSELYLLIQAGSNLFIIDQHTAHERVLYEETLELIEKSAINSQQLLFPEQFELSPEQLAVFEEAETQLNSFGFTVSGFGGRMVRIEAVPAILSKKSPQKIFLKVIDDIASLTKTGIDLKKAMAQTIACRAAVMAGDRLSDQEAEYLLQQLFKCDNMYSCPHGRPTFIKITRKDLDKQFGRI